MLSTRLPFTQLHTHTYRSSIIAYSHPIPFLSPPFWILDSSQLSTHQATDTIIKQTLNKQLAAYLFLVSGLCNLVDVWSQFRLLGPFLAFPVSRFQHHLIHPSQGTIHTFTRSTRSKSVIKQITETIVLVNQC